MHIGIDASGSSGWRGPGRNIRNIINYLASVGGQNEYYLFAPYDCTKYVNKAQNIKMVVVPYKKFVPWHCWSLPNAVKKVNLDIFIFPHVAFWLRKPMKTIVLTRTAFVPSWSDKFVDQFQAKLLTQRFKHIADRVCAVSHFNATQIQLTCGIPENKIAIVPNGVDPAFFDNTVKTFEPGYKYILFCGGSEERKNINNLIKAFIKIKDRGIKEKLLIVGGKLMPKENEMDTYLTEIHETKFKQEIVLYGIERDARALAGIYRGAELVVYPSLQEDFGMISVEAMACGTPLVASWMPSIPEIAGDAAIYFDPYDPADMAEKIELVLNNENLRQELIAKGYKRIKRYSWEKSAQKLLEIIEKVHNEK